MDLSRARDTFLDEARELLLQFEALLLKAESSRLEEEELNALFRVAHTIKGSAGLFGFDAIVSFTHSLESVLEDIRSGVLELNADLAELLFKSRDSIAILIDAIEKKPDIPIELSEYELAIQKSLLLFCEKKFDNESSLKKPSDESQKRWRISVKFGKNVMRDGIDPIACLRYLSSLGTFSEMKTNFYDMPDLWDLDVEDCYIGFDFVFCSVAPLSEIEGTFDFVREDSVVKIKPIQDEGEVLPTDSLAMPDQVKPSIIADKKNNIENRYLKIESAKLDQLINLVGELVIAGASANVIASDRRDDNLLEVLSMISSLVEQIRDGALTMRMVPVSEIFQVFPRIVRDLSRELGKEIELTMQGGDAELDKSMIDKLADPLMHIVRNAIDHGLEVPFDRENAGKSSMGHISLTAYHESGSIVIEVTDDGRGIDSEKVIARAKEKGLISTADGMSNSQIFKLLFEPGFSTAERVTNLSGRGVGLDVVKKNIEMLRGEIEVESERNFGTTMRLRLPLTLAIIDGFLVNIGKSDFVIPLDMVQECLECDHIAFEYGNCVTVRGEVLPCVDLRDLYGDKSPLPSWRYIVLVKYGNKRAGLIVDMLYGELQIVIKPLGKLFKSIRGLAGSTILGSGKVALILDIPQLINLAAEIEARSIEGRMIDFSG